MTIKEVNLTIFLILIVVQNTIEFRFVRRIEAIGTPYYKIMMALGACKEKVLYFDQKIWGKITLNRVFDIYYKCDDEHYKVSRVEIRLVINNTSSFAYSEDGVGSSEFTATLYLPTNLSIVIYTLTIYTCNRDRDSSEIRLFGKEDNAQKLMPFIYSDDNKEDTRTHQQREGLHTDHTELMNPEYL